jgi:hypothetical protein
MRTRLGGIRRWIGILVAAGLVASVLVLTLGAPLIWPDQSIPAKYEPYVASARSSLKSEIDGIRLPHLRLTGVRCRDDGGVAYLFDQIEAPYLQARYAIAMTGTWPPVGWSGGVSLARSLDDPELLYFLGDHEVSCG